MEEGECNSNSKINDEQVLKNDCPMSLLMISGKICKTFILNELSFFEDHKLFNPCQSEFKKNL